MPQQNTYTPSAQDVRDLLQHDERFFKGYWSRRKAVSRFYGEGSKSRNLEAHHWKLDRSEAKRGATLTAKYTPKTPQTIEKTINELIMWGIKLQETPYARDNPDKARLCLFAIDRILRLNECDITSRWRGRKILLSAFAALRAGKDGETLAESAEFANGLVAYITGVETVSNYESNQEFIATANSLGFFSDSQLFMYLLLPSEARESIRTLLNNRRNIDTACYQRIRNISNAILYILQCRKNKNRLDDNPDAPTIDEDIVPTGIHENMQRLQILMDTIEIEIAHHSDIASNQPLKRVISKLYDFFEYYQSPKDGWEDVIAFLNSEDFSERHQIERLAQTLFQVNQAQEGQSFQYPRNKNADFFALVDNRVIPKYEALMKTFDRILNDPSPDQRPTLVFFEDTPNPPDPTLAIRSNNTLGM